MFEQMLSRSREAPRSGRAVYLPAAIGLHAVALAAVVGASVWFTEEPPEPAPPVIFFVPEQPPAPLPGRSTFPDVARPRSNQRRGSFTAPLAIPERINEGREPGSVEVETSDAPGEPGEPGALDGIPGGIPGATGIDRSGLPDVAPPRPGGDISAPELVRRIEPAYPEIARRARQEGVVVVEAIISSSGTIEDVRVVKSAGVLLDSAAEEAVRKWRYRPATLNGRAVRVLLTVTVAFRLH